MPPMPAFYHRPSSLEDVIDQTVNRTLDMLGIELESDLFPRWQGPREKDRPARSRCRSVVSDWDPAPELSATPPLRSNVPIEENT
jgi:hypothetical protein